MTTETVTGRRTLVICIPELREKEVLTGGGDDGKTRVRSHCEREEVDFFHLEEGMRGIVLTLVLFYN